jgi:hypothetical protein
LRIAIRSPNDPGATLKRANTVLALYFDPDNDPATRAAVRKEFVVALSAYPDWAIQKAFDVWVKTGQRRPTPGEIGILVGRELKPIADELSRREREAAEAREARSELSPEELERRRVFAADVVGRAGYGFGVASRDGSLRETVTDADRAEMAEHMRSKGLA